MTWTEIAGLVHAVEQADPCDDGLPRIIAELVGRVQEWQSGRTDVGAAPAVSADVPAPVDVVSDPDAVMETFRRHGMVVVDEAVPAPQCAYAVQRVRAILGHLSGGEFDLGDASTWPALPADPSGEPILTRGFLEIYHDDGLAAVRQSPRLWLAHSLIWNTPRLSVTYDRYAAKLPGGAGRRPLPLHVDQNPVLQPGFASTQGMVALLDNPEENGCFIACPGTHAAFDRWRQAGSGRGHYVELATVGGTERADLWDRARPVPLRAGQAVIWDSRTVHAAGASTAPIPASTASTVAAAPGVRLCALVSAAAAVTDSDGAALRRSHFLSGEAIDSRDARCHASFAPRYTDPEALRAARRHERLSPLGSALYDSRGWDALLGAGPSGAQA